MGERKDISSGELLEKAKQVRAYFEEIGISVDKQPANAMAVIRLLVCSVYPSFNVEIRHDQSVL